jgi:hypothetical protein
MRQVNRSNVVYMYIGIKLSLDMLYIDAQELFMRVYPRIFTSGALQGVDDASVLNNIAIYLDDLICLLRPKRKCILVMNGMFKICKMVLM